MLTIENLSAGYGKVQVLHGISMTVPRGQVVTLIGSNGAGKTTTMRAVSGMIAPTGGTITLNGQRIDGLESYDVAKLGLAHSPEGRRVFATMTVADNLTLGAFPRLTGSRPRGDVPGDLEKALELFPRLKERQHQLAGTLSGGEQQMLAMARAVMLNPEVVLLDEPSMGLAPILVEEVFNITALAIASICCSPPDSVPASCVRRSFRRGNSSSARSRSPFTSPRGRARVRRGKAPRIRLSTTDMVANTRRPSGEWAMP